MSVMQVFFRGRFNFSVASLFAGLDTVPTRVRDAARGRTMGARNRTTVHVIQYASLIIENIYSEYYNSKIFKITLEN